MLMFPQYVQGLEKQEYQFLQSEHYRYYRSCIEEANQYLSSSEAADFRNWIRRRGKLHFGLREATDYGYSGLIYQMFEFSPFSDILSTEMSVGLVDLRPARNIAMFTQIINKFEYLHRVSVLDPEIHRQRGQRRTHRIRRGGVHVRMKQKMPERRQRRSDIFSWQQKNGQPAFREKVMRTGLWSEWRKPSSMTLVSDTCTFAVVRNPSTVRTKLTPGS